MQQWFDEIRPLLVNAGGRILFALGVLVIGLILIRVYLRLLKKGRLFRRANKTVRSFVYSAVRVVLYVLLVISVIGILGVPMGSIAAVLTSACVAIGLALQGALSNLAGGIMLMVFKPFGVGDFVEASGASGTVKEITLFYTTFLTPDGKRVLVPNGALMNANVTNFSSEEIRRVDVSFPCSRREDPERVRALLTEIMTGNEMILKSPEPVALQEPFGEESMNFTARCWCRTEDYWTVYYALTEAVGNAMTAAGVAQPVHRIEK